MIDSNMQVKNDTHDKKCQAKKIPEKIIPRRNIPIPDDVWRLVRVEKPHSDRQYGEIVTDCIRRVLGGAR